jgi:dienelactone hydrolase
MLYAPTPSAEVVGIVIVAPGSSGGIGPGIDRGRDGLPLPKSQSSAAFGSIYRRLGCEMADAGTIYDWRGSPIDAAVIAAGGTGGRSSITAAPSVSKFVAESLAKSAMPQQKPSHPPGAVAMLQISWRHTHGGRKWPTKKKMKLVSSLQTAANDAVAAVHFMKATYGQHLPLVLVGFSFGGPSVWAAAGKLTDAGMPPAGVVALAGSGRGGPAFETLGLDTLGCAQRSLDAGVAALLVHGTADHNVAVEVPLYLFNNLASSGDVQRALTLAIVVGSEHIFDLARDIVYAALKDWIQACIWGPSRGVASIAPCGPGANALQLRSGGRSEPFSLRPVMRTFLLKPEIKGYSEKKGKRAFTKIDLANDTQQCDNLVACEAAAETADCQTSSPLELNSVTLSESHVAAEMFDPPSLAELFV